MFRKTKKLLKDQLSQGISPRKLSQSLSFGIMIGCFPIFGVTTLIAAILAHVFKMNHLVVQSANYLMYPIHLALIPVYIKLASSIVEVGDIPHQPSLLLEHFHADPMGFFKKMGVLAFLAVLMWTLLTALLFPILCRFFEPLILRMGIKEE
jgi:uncharacterized protein (DUF2062 family)